MSKNQNVRIFLSLTFDFGRREFNNEPPDSLRICMQTFLFFALNPLLLLKRVPSNSAVKLWVKSSPDFSFLCNAHSLSQ